MCPKTKTFLSTLELQRKHLIERMREDFLEEIVFGISIERRKDFLRVTLQGKVLQKEGKT